LGVDFLDASNVVSNNGSFSDDIFSIFASNFSVNTGSFGNSHLHGFRWVGTLSVALHFLVFRFGVFPKFQGVDTCIHSSSDFGVKSILGLSVGTHLVSIAIGDSDFKLFSVQLLWYNSLISGRGPCLIDPIAVIFTTIGTIGVGGVCVSFSVSVGGNQCVPGRLGDISGRPLFVRSSEKLTD